MGMFSRGAGIAGIDLEKYDEIECESTDFSNYAVKTVVEAEANYNEIMKAVGIQEYNVFESTGTEMVYEAADVRGFISKVKQFFINLWQKIKGLFNKFCALINSYCKSDKDFVNKYKTQLLKTNMSGFKYKGYDFDNAKLSISVEKAYNAAVGVTGASSSAVEVESRADVIKAMGEDKSDTLEKMRGKALAAIGGSAGDYTSAEFSKELFQLFRNGEDSKIELSNISISDQLTYITETKASTKAAEKAYKELEKKIKEIIKSLDKAESNLSKGISKVDKNAVEGQSKSIRILNASISAHKEAASIAQIINGALLKALKDRNRQAKSICVSAMNYSPKNESAFDDGFNSFDEGSLLANVKIR